MSEVLLKSQLDMSIVDAAEHMSEFVHSNEAGLRQAGFHSVVRNYADFDTAFVQVGLRRRYMEELGISGYFVTAADKVVGIGSIIPDLELLAPANAFTGMLPRPAQKALGRVTSLVAQRVVIPSEQSVNIAMFVSPAVEKDGMIGASTVKVLTQLAASRHAGRTAWALLYPNASMTYSNREATYLRNGYRIQGWERYDDREPVNGVLPRTHLAQVVL